MRFCIAKYSAPAAFALALMVPMASSAQKVELNTSAGAFIETESTEAVTAAGVAAQLVDYGQEHELPLALATAAHLLIHAGVHQEELESTEEGGPVAAGGAADKPAGLDLDPEAILREASRLAGGNEALQSLIGNVQQLAEASSKGMVGGARTHTDVVQARSTDVYNGLTFRGDQSARILVQGDGDTDLDCYVYDENDNLIDSDADYTDRCTLSWRPSWTGPFRLKIRNLGGVWNRYTIVTN